VTRKVKKSQFEEMKRADETPLRAAPALDLQEFSPPVAELLDRLRKGEREMLSAEHLALPLTPAEAQAVVGIVRAKPLSRASLNESRKRGELQPLEQRGNSYRYTVRAVLDFAEFKRRKRGRPSLMGRTSVSSPAVVEILTLLRAGKREHLTPEQLTLPLARSEVREVLSCSLGEAFPQARLAHLIGRGVLLPLPPQRRGSGQRFRYSLQSVLDLVEHLTTPKPQIRSELEEVLAVLGTTGRDHLTRQSLDLQLSSAEVIMLATQVLGQPFTLRRLYELCRRKYNRLQAIQPRRGRRRLRYRVGDVLTALETLV
jgi:hypothetical protein